MRLGIATAAVHPAVTKADLRAASLVEGATVIAVPWETTPAPQVDALVIRSTWGYHHRVGEFEAWLRGLKVPVFNPVPLMLGNLNKRYLLDLERAGVNIVPTIFFSEPSLELPWKDAVLKPAVSASSHLTYRVSGDPRAAAAKVLERSEGLAQPFLAEIVRAGEISAIYHKARGRAPRYSHAVRKKPRAGDFRVQAEFGGTVEACGADRDFCEKVLACIEGEWLYARVDYVETAKGALLCELELVEPYLFYDQPSADLEGFALALRSHL